jgi:hypothetical protein
MLSAPVQKQIAVKFSGFYIGELDTPVAQVDVPIRATPFLTVTPSYMYYSVPASGLNKLPPQPGSFTDSFDEQQFRVDGTVAFAVRGFEISARNMYVRRFRPTPLDDMNRYRGRMAIARPLAVRGHVCKPFASYEDLLRTQRRVEQRENLDWRHGASQQAGVRSAVIHVGNQRRKPGRPLPVVRPDRQHAITPYSSSIHCERRLHVESIATRSRHRWRC